MQNKLYVGNLAFSATEAEVEEAFSAFGTVQSVNLVTDRETGRARGFGFVEMATEAEAQAAVEGLDQQNLGGRNLTVNIAKPRENRGGGGGRGGYGGGGGGRGGYGGGGGGGYGGGGGGGRW
ncbi:MAG: RNA-binding protein [Planctomycetota bacterium]